MARVCFSPDSLPLFYLLQPSGLLWYIYDESKAIRIRKIQEHLVSHKIANRRKYNMVSEVSLHDAGK